MLCVGDSWLQEILYFLPFTLANHHNENQIVVGALIIGIVFLVLSIRSLKKPHSICGYGLAVFGVVNLVAAITGASPLSEGWPVKLAFLLLLLFGAVQGKPGTRIKN